MKEKILNNRKKDYYIDYLPDELKSREKPSLRKNLEDISFEGYFKN